MSTRPTLGRGLFYTRDSMGKSDLAPPQYVEWAAKEATRLGVRFTGTSASIEAMIAGGISADGDLFLDYGISGNVLSRPGFDAFRALATRDTSVTHLFVPRRDRIARPDNPTDGATIELALRTTGLTLVFMNKVALPIAKGNRLDLADLLSTILDYNTSGEFRRELAEKLILAKVKLAELGFTIGGEPPFGFRRWLCSISGIPNRELADHEIVKLPGHHVVWLPTAEDELTVVRRILDLILTTPVARIARILNDEGIPSPNSGRTYTSNNVVLPVAGVWTANTVRNIATHPALIAVMEYGRRGMGDQLRFTAGGPRPLTDWDFGTDGKPRTVVNPRETMVTSAVPVKRESVLTPAQRDVILKTLDERGKHRKGKARARGDAPNPLGGRVFDMNCGWPMYRHSRRGRWCYQCALYQNSEARCCRHHVVNGPAATRFVLASVRQLVLSSGLLDKLRTRLEQLATSERGEDPRQRREGELRSELTKTTLLLAKVTRNMACAEDEEQRVAMASVFTELKAEKSTLERRLVELAPAQSGIDAKQEVESALAGLTHLSELAAGSDADLSAVGNLFRGLEARLYLRFEVLEQGRQTINVPAGGVLTFGSTPPPVNMYTGPTGRAIIRKMLADGVLVTASPVSVASRSSNSGQDVIGSANVKRGTTAFFLYFADERAAVQSLGVGKPLE